MSPPTITSAFSDFASSLSNIAFSLVNSILAFFQALFVLGKDFVGAVLQLGQSIVAFALHFFQGVFGVVSANILAIVLLGGGYYLYTTRQNKARGKGSIKKT